MFWTKIQQLFKQIAGNGGRKVHNIDKIEHELQFWCLIHMV